jgi:hypothetical protein
MDHNILLSPKNRDGNVCVKSQDGVFKYKCIIIWNAAEAAAAAAKLMFN